MLFGLVEHARLALAEAQKAPAAPPPCIWRMKKTQTPISSSIRHIRGQGRKSTSPDAVAGQFSPPAGRGSPRREIALEEIDTWNGVRISSRSSAITRP